MDPCCIRFKQGDPHEVHVFRPSGPGGRRRPRPVRPGPRRRHDHVRRPDDVGLHVLLELSGRRLRLHAGRAERLGAAHRRRHERAGHAELARRLRQRPQRLHPDDPPGRRRVRRVELRLADHLGPEGLVRLAVAELHARLRHGPAELDRPELPELHHPGLRRHRQRVGRPGHPARPRARDLRPDDRRPRRAGLHEPPQQDELIRRLTRMG